MYIQCMHLVYACLRFVLYSVPIECMLRMRLLILLVKKEEHFCYNPYQRLSCYRGLHIDLSCVLYKIYAHCYDAILYYMGTIMGTNAILYYMGTIMGTNAILYCTGTIDMGTIGINLYRHSDSPNVLCDRFKA